ncbi:dihydroorotate dehydrogenase [Desulfovibrio inopinatus]|uniref:iron-sulfur cluster-binding protein n=1 Tax=Desulfovibrio inopinatus TaxID=102109 RepID=UPI000418D261|nr:dihydroorotate dehydrogenase [Desulfovibrio inopinatus]
MNNPLCADVVVQRLSPYGPLGDDHGFYVLELENPGISSALGGQFVMIRRPSWSSRPLWGRPFSIHRISESSLEIFFQVVGCGTRDLLELSPGDTLTLWGPLGNGFAVEADTKTLMLAGGVGLAPFALYSETHPNPENLTLLFGHRIPLSCYPFDSLETCSLKTACQEHEPSDLDVFIADMETHIRDHADGLVLACGPTPFLRTVKRIAEACGARAQLSLENKMACGVGACLGCVCKTTEGQYTQVCTKGPVFWSTELCFDEGE